MRDLFDQLYERRFRRPEFLVRASDTLRGSFDQALPFASYREFIADVDESDCARPLEDVRSSGLDLSLIPYLPLMNGREE